MLVRFFQSIVLTIGGGAVLLYALTVLGWRRHGASPIDMTFLHLDWMLRPELPYWQAHMANLAIEAAGDQRFQWGMPGRDCRTWPPMQPGT
jgi:hypothetical protein